MPASAILNVENAFYLSIVLLAATLVYLVFILPESRQSTLEDMEVPSGSHIQLKVPPIVILRRYLHRFASAVLIPVTIFAPHQIAGQPHRKNYNLTLVGATIFLFVVSGVRSLSFRIFLPFLIVPFRALPRSNTYMPSMYTTGQLRRY